MATIKELHHALIIIHSSNPQRKLETTLDMLQAAKPPKQDNPDNWLSETTLVILYIMPELMRAPNNEELRQFCLKLKPTELKLPEFLQEEFI